MMEEDSAPAIKMELACVETPARTSVRLVVLCVSQMLESVKPASSWCGVPLESGVVGVVEALARKIVGFVVLGVPLEPVRLASSR